MFCPNCGANIPGAFDVCPECGTEITVRQSHGGGDGVPFIVAEDARDKHTPIGQVMQVPEGGGNTHQDAIIEAEEDELSEEETDILLTPSGADTTGRILPDGNSLSDRRWSDLFKETDRANVPSGDDRASGTGREQTRSFDASSPGDAPSSGQSPDPLETETSGDAKNKPRSSVWDTYIEPPSPPRRFPLIVGLAVMILAVLGFALLSNGMPGQGSGEPLVPVPTLPATVLPYASPVPTTELVHTFIQSDNLILSVSAYGGGYKVEIDRGLMANEVAKILMTIEDTGGLHSMEWVYPSRHETFFMAREAYNGTVSAIEHVIATATFTDGHKEVVFSGDL